MESVALWTPMSSVPQKADKFNLSLWWPFLGAVQPPIKVDSLHKGPVIWKSLPWYFFRLAGPREGSLIHPGFCAWDPPLYCTLHWRHGSTLPPAQWWDAQDSRQVCRGKKNTPLGSVIIYAVIGMFNSLNVDLIVVKKLIFARHVENFMELLPVWRTEFSRTLL